MAWLVGLLAGWPAGCWPDGQPAGCVIHLRLESLVTFLFEFGTNLASMAALGKPAAFANAPEPLHRYPRLTNPSQTRQQAEGRPWQGLLNS